MPRPAVTPSALLVRLTGVLLVVVAGLQLVAPAPSLHRPRWWVVLPLTVVLLATAWWRRDALGGPVPRRLTSPRAVAAVGGLLCGVHVAATGYPAGWDAGALWSVAEQQVAGRPLDEGQVAYLSRYPLNLPLVAVLRVVVGAQHLTGLPASVVVGVLSAVVAGAVLAQTGLLLARTTPDGREISTRGGLLAQALVLVLVGLSPWMVVVYTDLLLLVFPLALLRCLQRAGRAADLRSRVAWAAAGGLVGAVGMSLKATLVVALGGIALALVVAPRRRPRWWLSLVVALAVLLPGTAVAGALWREGSGVASQVRPGVAFPVERWLWTGLSARTTGDGEVLRGVYDGRIDATLDGRPTEESRRISREQVGRRLGELGPAGLLTWWWHKTRWNLADGTFFAYGEGYDELSAARAVRAAPAWQVPARWWSSVGGGGFPAYVTLLQALWLSTLLVTGACCLRARADRLGPVLVAAAASVLGIVAFTAVMEARPRYVFAFVPVVVVLGGLARDAATEPPAS